MFLRNAPTKMMKEMGYGKGYVYPPHTSNGIVATKYLPPSLQGKEFYTPSEEGKEKQFKQRLEILRKKLHKE
jgi:putative ATPase